MFYLCVRAQCAPLTGYRVPTVYKLIFNSSQPKEHKKNPKFRVLLLLHLRAEYLEDKACGNNEPTTPATFRCL